MIEFLLLLILGVLWLGPGPMTWGAVIFLAIYAVLKLWAWLADKRYL